MGGRLEKQAEKGKKISSTRMGRKRIKGKLPFFGKVDLLTS